MWDIAGTAALKLFLDCPWVQRTWAFQESFLAGRTKVQYTGFHRLNTQDVQYTMVNVILLRGDDPEPRHYRTSNKIISRRRFPFEDDFTLWSLLTARGGSSCKGPRDLVYSPLVLVNARKMAHIEYNHEDMSWLSRLEKEPFTVELEEFLVK